MSAPPVPSYRASFTEDDIRRLPGLCPADDASDVYDTLASAERSVLQDAHPETDASTSVQPPETKPPRSVQDTAWGTRLTSDDLPVTFRHSGWASARAHIREALHTNYGSPNALKRFDLCGSDPWVAVDENDPEHVAILTNHCRSRWCVPCSRERSARIVGNLVKGMHQQTIRFLTLTMKHSRTPLRDQINRMYDCFRRLRQSPVWKARIHGGAAVLEIKHSWRDQLWHVHVHCLIAGHYVRHDDLKAEWFHVTGDSNVIDIRSCGTHAIAAHYVAKYITKPIAQTVINKPKALCELIGACARRRLVLTWGTWRGLKLSAKLDDTVWKSLYSLEDVYRKADDGDADALALVAALDEAYPEARAFAGRAPPGNDASPVYLTPINSVDPRGLLP